MVGKVSKGICYSKFLFGERKVGVSDWGMRLIGFMRR